MECKWDAALLRRVDELPPELLQVIQHGDDAQYLNAITKASLDPRYTYLLFAHCEDLFAHVCATARSHGSLPSAIATLGRVVPFAPFLLPYAERLLADEYALGSFQNVDEDLLYLLGLFRLFNFDWRTVKPFVQPSSIAPFLESSSRPIVYLAIRILQIYYNGADHWFEQMVQRYLGKDSAGNDINGAWDDRVIDYRFLTLWEEDRSTKVQKLIDDVRSASESISQHQLRVLQPHCFEESTALVGGVLLPRRANTATSSQAPTTSLVQTHSIMRNLDQIATALKSPGPLLLDGPAGAGKTLLVRQVAHSLGALDSMVTLHLNQQSDAKLLMGVYTTGPTPGSFVWKPGVLTTAVQEGRWVLVEDLDRAPDEIIGTLLPLIERGELTISNRKQTIYAATGFRILATVRTTINHRGQSVTPLVDMLGIRHWQRVSIEPPSQEELHQITNQLYPALDGLLPQFHALYNRFFTSWRHILTVRHGRAGMPRTLSPRDLLKWCSRVSALLRNKTTYSSIDADHVFLEAIDCFAGALTDGQLRNDIAAMCAEELRVDPQRRDYLLSHREVQYKTDDQRLSIGRYALVRLPQSKRMGAMQGSFSTNPHTSHMMEKVAGALINREPLLLVGETGVGKTAAVQHLATQLGKKLVPFNLSQQSEAGDLLGGFKPVNARSLFIPMKNEFNDLFADSFSLSKNQQFLNLLGKQTSRGNWKAICKLWQQALKMVDQQRVTDRSGEAPNKKRKVEQKRSIDFARWDAFAIKVTAMEHRLASSGDAFAFSFIEGNIVKALRNGDWILLDEINLASTDTLESIADLLDQSAPSLLLTESGSIERIEAHPDFRVFAAMNPTTDVGKKDLPPGIRSRFTEIYVDSPDMDIKSLSSIVHSYLRHEATGDKAVAVDVSKLYQSIQELAAQNKLVDGAGTKPHFSLRTLTRTLSYTKYIAPFCSLRRSLYEGFQMSFLTLLDDESVRLVQPLIEQSLFDKRTNIRAELQKALRRPSNQHVQGFAKSKHWIHQGPLPTEEQPHYILTPFIQANLENLARATSTRQFPVLIQGPTSSGKTSMIEYLAKRTGHKFVRINNHEYTDLQEYLGTYVSGIDGHLQFQDGILVKALREGHWIVLDELNLAPTDVLEALNRLLDDNRELLIPETQEVVRPHHDFMLFATQNPAGLYGGRKVLSRAFRNRFLELHFDDIPIDELQDILHQRTALPESRCKRIVGVYRELSVLRQENRLFEQRSFATLRDLFRWAQRPNDTIEQLAANGFMLLGERVRKEEDRQTLKDIIEKLMSLNGPRVKIHESQLYSKEAQEVMHYERNIQDRSIVWTKAMRRLYVLVARALENNEPVLLVGETGCGKTTVCQMLADALGQKLHSVNAHQNTETGDLIGSQRPVRNRAAIEANLRHQLLSSNLLQSLSNASEHTTDDLLENHDRAVALLSNEVKTKYSQSSEYGALQAERTRYKALFEWVDGSLVQAMREGAFFLLDEISLADDSVLERINSVLESQRSILLAEKGSIDFDVTAAPGFQFFATMNPGGDYGKRELSPALRNRFTEIWVPPLSDIDDTVQIIHEKLNIAAKNFARPMIDFAQWFRDRYNTTASLSISIRDTLAWASFVNACGNYGEVSAIVHGAAMVYVDTLGANPAGLMAIDRYTIEEEREACINQLAHFLHDDANATYNAAPELSLTNERFTVGPFSLPVRNGAKQLSAFSFEPQTTRFNTLRVVRALQLSKPLLLEGNPGVGKTALVTAIAEAIGVPLTRINLSEQTDVMDLFGSDVPLEGAETGNFAWSDAPFLRAMKNGEWVLLDEMNLASQSVLEGLNACLDHRGEVFVPELGLTLAQHPNFKLFAAQNPHHQGGGRKGLPASFVNRFTVVYADAFRLYDLKLISQRSFPNIDSGTMDKLIALVDDLSRETSQQKRIGAKGAPWEFNYRDISRLLTLATSEQDLLKAGNMRDFTDLVFSQRFRSPSDKAFVDELIRRYFGNDLFLSDLFSTQSTSKMQLGLALLHKDMTVAVAKPVNPTNSNCSHYRRVLQSLMLCVQHNWPVVLTGRSGVGKTQLVECLAATVGANVVTLSVNAETDAMDLIGGFEQVDPDWEAGQFNTKLRIQGDRDVLARLTQSSSPDHFADHVDTELPTATETAASIAKPKFEWIDGLLVDALRDGKWLVLDNANLCSPSVLDRLNSLLEPNGVLIVNERSNADGSPRIFRPHPDFRIFLTVNPKYGELSRAMRNRAVELYLLETVQTGPEKRVEPLPTESAMMRLRTIGTLDPHAGENLNMEHLVQVASDHLGPVDESLVQRFVAQVSSGLYGFTKASTQALVKALQPQLQAQITAVECSTQLYSAILGQTQVPADFARVQTFHPLNNQPLIQLSQQATQLAVHYAFIYDTSVQLGSVSRMLQNTRSNSTMVANMSRFERSLGLNTKSSGSQNKPAGILESLDVVLKQVSYWLDELLAGPTVDLVEAKTIAGRLIALAMLWLRLISQQKLDAANLNVLASLGRSITNFFSSTFPEAVRAPLQTIDHAFDSILTKTGFSNQSGCVALWRGLKPITPANHEQFRALMKLDEIIARFDDVCRLFALPFEKLVDLRISFMRARQLASQTNEAVEELSSRLKGVMLDTSAGTNESQDSPIPHFRTTFRQLSEHFNVLGLGGHSISARQQASLDVLALRGAKASYSSYSLDGAQSKLLFLEPTLCSVADETLGSLSYSTVDSSLVHDLLNTEQVSLSRLDLLETEAQFLGQVVSSQAHLLGDGSCRCLDICLRDITTDVLNALVDRADNWELRQPAIELKHQLVESDASNTAVLSTQTSRGETANSESIPHPLHNVVKYLRTARKDRPADLVQAANAWACFACACLQMYVPNGAFDPALENQLQRSLYFIQHSDLTARYEALQSFRGSLTGERQSMRARTLQHDITDLGQPPEDDCIYRPTASQLPELQADLDRLMQILQPFWQPGQNYSSMLPLSRTLRSNIVQVRKRISTLYRAYEDFIAPIVGFIDCLLVAHKLATLATAEDKSNSKHVTLMKIIPFVGASLDSWVSDAAFVGASRDLNRSADVICWLSAICVRSSIEKTTKYDYSLLQDIELRFDQFYQRWKAQLDEERKSVSAKSSLYKYRYQEDSSDEVTPEDLDGLFPIESPVQAGVFGNGVETSAQEEASDIARLHLGIFQQQKPNNGAFEELLQQWAALTGDQAQEADLGSSTPLMMLLLCKLQFRLTSKDPLPKTYNMYTDANIGQIRVLLQMLDNLRRRFSHLQNTWPEHATPVEVLRLCQDILEIPHSSPLAALLPRLEKLYTAVNDWQSIASRGFSVQDQLNQMSNLIISWRQLELSTWAGLFDREWNTCQKMAASWWYVAHETIIATTKDFDADFEESIEHTTKLLRVLEDFVQSSGLGEFASRLEMLRGFEAQLAVGSANTPLRARIRSALHHFNKFYSRFEDAVSAQLSSGRAKLEKEVREVIQLASWKDRNIDVLRQSAISSHKKLLRLVRKFRKLLAQPVLPVISEGLRDIAKSGLPTRQTSNLLITAGNESSDSSSMSIAWHERPIRFRNPDQTAQLILSKVEKLQSSLEASVQLKSFTDDLVMQAAELQKATPSTLTEENTSLVRHLKTRKRRLLADVLKTVRKMGFSTSLGDQALEQQKSSSAVFSRMPMLLDHRSVTGADIAEHELHQFLRAISIAREASRKHSVELTSAEVTRSLGLLESVLQVGISCHGSLSTNLEGREDIDSAIQQFTTIASISEQSLAYTENGEADIRHIRIEALHLRQAILTASELLRAQEHMTSKDYSDLTEYLTLAIVRLTTLLDEADRLPQLPSGFQSGECVSLRARCKETNRGLQAKVEAFATIHPETTPIVDELLKWTSSQRAYPSDLYTNGTTSPDLNDWIQDLFAVLDTMLRAIEDIEKVQQRYHESTNGSYIIAQVASLDNAFDSLRMQSIAMSMSKLLMKLQHLDVTKSATIAEVLNIFRTLSPIVEAYAQAVNSLLELRCALYSHICNTGYTLSRLFTDIAKRGFCKPSDKTEGDDGQSGEVEAGTGLGDGEGGDDISKDIGNDEDLSELAQDGQREKQETGMEDEKDAVDMADEEMAGEIDDATAASENGEDDNRGSDDEDADVDEQVGEGSLDTDAIDEKMWDGGADEENPQKEAQAGKGSAKNDEVEAAEESKEQDDDRLADDETEVVGKDEGAADDQETLDPHVDKASNLELPEDIDKDDNQSLGDEDMDMVSPEGTTEPADNVDSPHDNDLTRDEEMSDETSPEAHEDEDPTVEGMKDEAANAPMNEEPGPPELQIRDEYVPEDAGDGAILGDEREAPSRGEHGGDQAEETQRPEDGIEDGADRSEENASTGPGKRGAQDSKLPQKTNEMREEDDLVPYKQLGDVLDEWYNKHREVSNARRDSDAEHDATNEQTDLEGAEFEHLPDDTATADAQALGAASTDQAVALNEDKAVGNEDEMVDSPPHLDDQGNDEQEENQNHPRTEEHSMQVDSTVDPISTAQPKSFVGEPQDMEDIQDNSRSLGSESDSEDGDLADDIFPDAQLSLDEKMDKLALDDAQKLWAKHEDSTRNLALILTEHLRLILQPTQATRMRGDFRTGKRLNIKRIIPYIASSYKRDKIWMRRSTPTKRSYQIMLAIDDSKSMAESRSDELAFETLALVAKSMSMLEVGELSVIGFGDSVNVAHDFSTPFTSDAGARTIQQFTFSQGKTNVKRLLTETIALFRSARLSASGSASDLWQLQLIISDGICDDHPSIRQLVREAFEERIMIVFIVVDFTTHFASETMSSKQSILDMPTAQFVKDSAGNTELKMMKYLDTFPFRYYLIVQNIQELPHVLAGALRQWFAEVVETAS